MAKKNYSELLNRSLNGRDSAPEEETVIKEERPEQKDVSEKEEDIKQKQPEENPAEQKFNLAKLEPQPSELLGSGIVIAGKRGAIRQARTVNFEEDLLKKIDEIAKDHNISFSAVINQILRQVL